MKEKSTNMKVKKCKWLIFKLWKLIKTEFDLISKLYLKTEYFLIMIKVFAFISMDF